MGRQIHLLYCDIAPMLDRYSDIYGSFYSFAKELKITSLSVKTMYQKGRDNKSKSYDNGFEVLSTVCRGLNCSPFDIIFDLVADEDDCVYDEETDTWEGPFKPVELPEEYEDWRLDPEENLCIDISPVMRKNKYSAALVAELAEVTPATIRGYRKRSGHIRWNRLSRVLTALDCNLYEVLTTIPNV